MTARSASLIVSSLGIFLAMAGAGCHSVHEMHNPTSAPMCPDVPRELDKVNLPEYMIEPPDILLIEAVKAVPKPPYKIEPLDSIFVQLGNPIKEEPLSGLFTIEPDGTINLGATYGGSVNVNGMTIPEATKVIEQHLVKIIRDPIVTVSLGQSRAAQRISGPHLVRPDGTVGLGTYGSVRVTGMTLTQAKQAIEQQLSQYLTKPEVSVDVGAYNSKTFYVILDGAGSGQQVVRLPSTGNETVLDAVSQVNGLSPVSSKHRVWIARPAPFGNQNQILAVNWEAVSMLGESATNYQLLPGDRLYIDAQPVVALDNYLAKIFAPIERVLGITLLGVSTAQQFRNFNNNNFGNNGFNNGF
jgi:polysaccharide export outer membrane protein